MKELTVVVLLRDLKADLKLALKKKLSERDLLHRTFIAGQIAELERIVTYLELRKENQDEPAAPKKP